MMSPHLAGESSTGSTFHLLIKDLLQALTELSHQLSENDNLDIALERIFDILLNLHDYCAVWIYRRDEDKDTVVLQAHKGLSREVIQAEKRLDLKDCVTEFVLRSGQAISLKDMQHCRRLPKEVLLNGMEMQAHLSLPIRQEDKTIGVLHVGSRHKRKFLVPELQFLSVISSLIALLFKLDRSRRLTSEFQGLIQDVGLQSLVGKIVDGILVMEKDFRVTLINPEGKVFLGTCTELEKGEFFDQLSKLQQGILEDLIVAGKEILELDLHLSPPAGKILHLTATPLKRPSGKVDSVMMVVKDVSGEKASARKERIQMQVSSFSSLLDGITHELNNPLAAVSGYLQMLQIKYAADPALVELAVKMDRELNRAIVIVRNLLALAEKKPIEKIPVHLPKLLEKVLEDRRDSLDKSAVTISLSLDPQLPVLYLEVDNMRQVFTNIIESAVRHLAESAGGGTLGITVQRKEDAVQIVFDYPGPGFFPLPPAGTSAGLETEAHELEIRLAFCSMVVKNHGGVIYAESGAGKGGGFIIELPLFPEELEGEA